MLSACPNTRPAACTCLARFTNLPPRHCDQSAVLIFSLFLLPGPFSLFLLSAFSLPPAFLCSLLHVLCFCLLFSFFFLLSAFLFSAVRFLFFCFLGVAFRRSALFSQCSVARWDKQNWGGKGEIELARITVSGHHRRTVVFLCICFGFSPLTRVTLFSASLPALLGWDRARRYDNMFCFGSLP